MGYTLFCLLLPIQYAVAGNIIDTSDYSYWRQLASSSHFYTAMKVDAIHTANNGSETRDVMGGCALAYILDPENKALTDRDFNPQRLITDRDFNPQRLTPGAQDYWGHPLLDLSDLLDRGAHEFQPAEENHEH